MVSIDELHRMLDEIAESLPKEFYEKLNGGIILLPQVKIHPESRNNDLYIMGEYHYSYTLGRYIAIYYGSFERVYGNLNKDELSEKLRHTLVHEFTHHIESLAGDQGLEVKDKIELKNYKEKFRKK